jgi:hypothetical protein
MLNNRYIVKQHTQSTLPQTSYVDKGTGIWLTWSKRVATQSHRYASKLLLAIGILAHVSADVAGGESHICTIYTYMIDYLACSLALLMNDWMPGWALMNDCTSAYPRFSSTPSC